MSKNPITILSIDDEKDIRYALKAVFDFEGWNSLLASNVEEGIKMFIEKKPDIVIIDYHLPRINGIKGVELLRNLSATVPILVFTIDESQEVADRFLAAGASDFALKPIKAPDLISRISLHIRLLESQNSLETFNTLPKGISLITLDLIKDFFKEQTKFMDINQISVATGLAPQTINRYIQYMLESGLIEMQLNYGKVGRPKQEYILKK